MILRRRGLERSEQRRECSGGPFIAWAQFFYGADYFVERANPECGHAFADFGGNSLEIRHHHFGISGEARAEFFVLRGDADGASVQMALARHHAADGEQRGGAEAELVGAEKGGDEDVAAEFEAAVRAKAHAIAETGTQKRGVRVAEADFPGQAGIFDRSERRCTGAAVEAGDGDDVSASFGDPCSNDSDARAGDEFYADTGGRIDGAQIVD